MSSDTAVNLPERLAEKLADHLVRNITLQHLMSASMYPPEPAPLKKILMRGYGYYELPHLDHALFVLTAKNDLPGEQPGKPFLQLYFGRILAEIQGKHMKGTSHYEQVKLPDGNSVEIHYNDIAIFEKVEAFVGDGNEAPPPPTCVVIELTGGDLEMESFMRGWDVALASIGSIGA